MPTYTELLQHKAVLGALALTALIIVGSGAYYVSGVHGPAPAPAPAAADSNDVTGSGTVTPVQNPDLAFVAGGRVAYVNASVGQKVGQGTLLASLDTGVLSANYAAADARYEEVLQGPRPVDVAGKETAVTLAQTTLDNAYAALPAVIADASAKTEDAVHATDYLFGSFSVSDYPRVSFRSRDDSAAEKAGQDRGALSDSFDAWSREQALLSASTPPASLDAALAESITHVSLARDFFTNLSGAVNAADPSLSAADIAAVSAGRTEVNALVLALTAEQQTLSSDALALQSAKDALALTQAGATSQDIAIAKAARDAAGATLAQSEIIAPFPGTVAAVAVKSGDVVAPNTVGISLLPDSAFEVEVYLSEIDMAKVTQGDTADVTLDAYGPSKVFGATVSSIDRAPTTHDGVLAYKATLVFDEKDPTLTSGLGANAVIHTTH